MKAFFILAHCRPLQLNWRQNMKYTLLAVIASLLTINTKAQNLVRNGSFENTDDCPIASPLFQDYVRPWTYFIGEPDYFHPCGDPGNAATTNNALAFDGGGFIGLDVYGQDNGQYLRDYAHGELERPLDSGVLYRVTFYVLPVNNDGETISMGIRDIGVLLTDSIIDTIPDNNVLSDYRPQVKAASPVVQQNYWTSICGFYRAKGGERYLTIGNFSIDEETEFLPLDNATNPQRGYILVDYLQIVENDFPSLPQDTVICAEGRIDLIIDAPNISVEWEDETTDRLYVVTEPGLYTAQISNGICTYTDSILVEPINCNECVIYAPKAFTPLNGDELNQTWAVIPSCAEEGLLLEYDLKIYDRWGRKVFESASHEVGWDGNNASYRGIYTYTLEYTFASERKRKTRFDRGFFTLLE